MTFRALSQLCFDEILKSMVETEIDSSRSLSCFQLNENSTCVIVLIVLFAFSNFINDLQQEKMRK